MTLLDWTFYVAGIFCCLESTRFGRFKERAFMVGVGLFSAAIIAASIGCAPAPTAPTSTYVPAPVGDGSARVSTLSTRDLPATSPGNQGPTGPVQDFRMNGLGGLPEGRVLPQFRRITDQDTVQFYWLETARRNDLRPPDTLFATPTPQGHEPIRVNRLGPLEMDSQPLYDFKPGTYDARVRAVYRGGSMSAWAYTTFSVDGTWWEEPASACAVYLAFDAIDPKTCVAHD